ncbi:hypothetical protein AAW14_00475 [Streptomyces hygroscopicus]|uniref:phosphotransferase n=1 Tax=Streptomyces hygroscopicus TaxID=1912 RepID=UPI00223EDB57|nr:lipopolysaccharide kinase InaA family protein [Streptomyces hygroscopicus]MCW7940575.1 hypothetical protein [Streptomyces hygroscopicus]
MSATSLWEPGYTFGRTDHPDEFELEQFIHRGGEGELWKARRQDRDGNPTWHAVKILRADATTPPQEPTAWRNRWMDSVHAANEIHIAELIRSAYLEGVQPHAKCAPGEPGGVYLIGPWMKDARPLDQWARDSTAPPHKRLRVLVRLSRIIDALHHAGWAHRDISGDNVLVDTAGNCFVIDLTFLKRLDQDISVLVGTAGYATLEEETCGQPPSLYKDCLAVGVLARVLLLPHLPLHPSAEALMAAAPEQLAAAGYSTAVTDCLMRALDREPLRRPSPLLPWAQELRRLVAADPDPGQLCMALSTDALNRPVAATGGDRGLRWFTAPVPGTDPAGNQLPSPDGQPLDLRELATANDARGHLVAAAVDGSGNLWYTGQNGGWTVLAGQARGLAVLVSTRGEVLIWTAQPEGILRVRLSPDSTPPQQEALPAAPDSRVLAATWDAAGRAAVLVGEPGRVTHCTWPAHHDELPQWAAVCAVPAVRATIALHRGWGELEADLVAADGTRHSLSRHHSGAPWENTETSPSPGTYTALRSIRHGIARATAGPDGLTVVTETSTTAKKHILYTGPARLVALHAAPDGNLHVATLADGEIRCWSETWTETWVPATHRQSTLAAAATGMSEPVPRPPSRA